LAFIQLSIYRIYKYIVSDIFLSPNPAVGSSVLHVVNLMFRTKDFGLPWLKEGRKREGEREREREGERRKGGKQRKTDRQIDLQIE
jgi:hypothetical protein